MFGAIAGVILPAIGMPLILGEGWLAVVGFIFIVGGPLGAASSIKRLFGDGVALQFDAAELRIATSWSSASFRWSQVRSVTTSQLVTRMLGFIPVNRQKFIDFGVEGGMFGTRTIRLAVSMLDIRKADLSPLIAELQLLQAGQPVALARQSTAAAATRDPLEGISRDNGFDADAALARYLANRPAPAPQEAPTAPAAPARPTFGRKVA